MLTSQQVDSLKKGDKVYYNNNGRITEWEVDYPRVLINEKHSKMVYNGTDYKLAIDTPAGGGECQSVDGKGCIRVSMPTPNGRGSARMSLLISDFDNWSLTAEGEVEATPNQPTDQGGEEGSQENPNQEPEVPAEEQPAPTLASLMALNPSYQATEVPVNTSIELTFDGAISVGTGNITISCDNDTKRMDVTSENVEFNGSTITIVLDSDLLPNETYTVTIDNGAVLDANTGTSIDVLGTYDYTFTTVSE